MTVVDKREGLSMEGTIYEACWPCLIQDLPTSSQYQKDLLKCIVQMSRYGHMDPRGWDDVELTEFRDLYMELVELLKGEDAVTATTEHNR